MMAILGHRYILFDDFMSPSTSVPCEHRSDLWWPWDGCAPGNQLTGICSGTFSSLGSLQFPFLDSSVLQSWLSSYMLFCEPQLTANNSFGLNNGLLKVHFYMKETCQ